MHHIYTNVGYCIITIPLNINNRDLYPDSQQAAQDNWALVLSTIIGLITVYGTAGVLYRELLPITVSLIRLQH